MQDLLEEPPLKIAYKEVCLLACKNEGFCRKKSIVTEKDFERQWITKQTSDNFWSSSCGENLWGDIWAGAVSRCGCGVRVRVRFTCGQTFARTPGSGNTTHKKLGTSFSQWKNPVLTWFYQPGITTVIPWYYRVGKTKKYLLKKHKKWSVTLVLPPWLKLLPW